MADDAELLLPRASIDKVVTDTLVGAAARSGSSEDKTTEWKVSAQAKMLILKCASEFAIMLGSESNDVCGRDCEDRKMKVTTIKPEHVIKALRQLDFEEYVAKAEEMKARSKEETSRKKSLSGKLKGKQKEFSAEELAKMQEDMFAKAREKFMT